MNSENKPLKTGYTTGSCATAATAAALDLLLNGMNCEFIEISLPSGDTATLKVEYTSSDANSATAAIRKDAGDDPDITHGALISSTVKLNDTVSIRFFAGDGVGIVTKEGLQIPVGEPAINPVPREMMEKTVREFTKSGIDITISVEGGENLAKKTFNPKLGIEGGISIIGTSGIVRPFSHEAIQDTVRVSLNVAAAAGKTRLALVAGHYGMSAVQKLFKVEGDEIIEVSNEWGTALEHAKEKEIRSLLILSHPGKLAKFIDGHFNTHSSFSPSALPIVKRIAADMSITTSAESSTVDGIFKELSKEDSKKLASDLAFQISSAAIMQSDIENITVVLIDMKQNELGNSGETKIWQRRELQ